MPDLHWLLAYAVPVVLAGFAGSCLLYPKAMIETLGFQVSDKEPISPILYSFGLRELSTGLAVGLLLDLGEYRAVAVVMGCIGLNGLGDFVLDGMKGQGWGHALRMHGVATLAAYWAAWSIWQDL
jgi:hypothetical protein